MPLHMNSGPTFQTRAWDLTIATVLVLEHLKYPCYHPLSKTSISPPLNLVTNVGNSTNIDTFQQFKIFDHYINKNANYSKNIFKNYISCLYQCKCFLSSFSYRKKTKALRGMAGKNQKIHWVPEDELEGTLLA